jgi:hypothetical protein
MQWCSLGRSRVEWNGHLQDNNYAFEVLPHHAAHYRDLLLEANLDRPANRL